MAVTPIYTTNLMNMPRSYMKGFVGCSGCSNMHWSGETLVCDFSGTTFRFELVVKHKFYVPSSNVYSLDYVFDNAASQVYQLGLPVASSMWYGFYPMTTKAEWRILILSSLPADETQLLDLPPMPSSYWQPLP